MEKPKKLNLKEYEEYKTVGAGAFLFQKNILFLKNFLLLFFLVKKIKKL